MSYAIGIEIGGTKLQAGVGLREDQLVSLARASIDPTQGAEGIRNALPELVDQALREAKMPLSDIQGISVGFGGPIDSKQGLTLKSHQIEGWDHFPLQSWMEDKWQRPVSIQNDASIAGYAEAMIGAGKGFSRVFYITIGSGIGGGWILDGRIDEGQGMGAAEIGHTWVVDPDTGEPEKLEYLSSGWSIGRSAQDALEFGETSKMREMVKGDLTQVTAKTVYAAAEQNDLLALTLLENACQALALAICNVIALYHPERIVLGGGVSLMGQLFWDKLNEKIDEFIFEPFAGKYEVVPSALGEEVVVIGATLLGLSLRQTIY